MERLCCGGGGSRSDGMKRVYCVPIAAVDRRQKEALSRLIVECRDDPNHLLLWPYLYIILLRPLLLL